MKTFSVRILLTALASTGFVVPAAAQEVVEPTGASSQTDAAGSQCELHIWPIENYYTDMSGLLSAIPIVGVAIDQGTRKNSSKSVQGLMGEYLSPEIQIELLKKHEVARALGLDGYQIIVEDAFPSDEALKKSKELKAKRKARIAKIKAKKRQSESQSKCYAELAITFMVYQKTAVYDSNFTIGWSYYYFGDSPTVLKEYFSNSGEIRDGSLQFFPPKTEADIEPSKQELQDQFSNGFLYVARNLPR